LNCHSTQEISHLAVDNFSNTPRGVNRPNTEPLRDLVVHGAGGSLNVETHATADKVSASRMPSKRSASVTVGSVPPRP